MFGDMVVRIETDAPLVALTFDDGPSSNHTAEILDILAAHDVLATFFVTGREAEENPDQLRALITAGHDIGNHSFSHRRMVLMSPQTVRDELARTDSAIRAAGYQGPITFRPPYGKRLVVLPWILAQEDRLTAMWDVDPGSTPGATAATIAENAVEAARPGSIILLHAMYDSRTPTRNALDSIIAGLRAKGLEPVPLSELLAER